jgi:hypothetical protein
MNRKKNSAVSLIQVRADASRPDTKIGTVPQNPPQPIGEIVDELLDRYFRVFPDVAVRAGEEQLAAV